jgi:hypothetical protein
MTTVDSLLLDIAYHGFDKLIPAISRRDLRILRNIAHLIKTPDFISENQGSLLVKILKENKASLQFLEPMLTELLITPEWSRYFRQFEQIRKISIFSPDEVEKFIGIEFTYHASIKKLIQNMQTKAEGTVLVNIDKKYCLSSKYSKGRTLCNGGHTSRLGENSHFLK